VVKINVSNQLKESTMKSIMSKISIIILSLLASTFTFAFDHGSVCSAMNAAVSDQPVPNSTPIFAGPIFSIYSRYTDPSDPRGEVCGSVFNAESRICGQSGLECSGKTCHINKEWADCECTSHLCTNKQEAIDNCHKLEGAPETYGILDGKDENDLKNGNWCMQR